ncbi:MAG: hypothetical protein LBQ87_06940 [Candidatus Fibromonas sp.]|jgi:hypothetical protein|nr:hypothetical protein [Candidatus Fibromonas sp.]
MLPLLLLLLALPVLAQNPAPQWVEESWRASRYPNTEWYTGFARDNIKGQPNSETYQSIEKEAQKRLIESINIRISGTSTSKTKMASSSKSETIDQNYAQTIQVSTNAEIARTETRSYYDAKNNTIYAFATVKKSDLADYYAARIEFYLKEAQRDIDFSKQLLELDKRKEALEKLDGGKKFIDSTAYYRNLLAAVDTQNGAKRSQVERISEFLNEIAAMQAKAEDAMLMFVTGTESIQNRASDIIVPGLQTILSDNNFKITEDEKEAGYILKIDAKICNSATADDIYYAYACVKVALTNAKTGKNEILLTVNGKKASALDAEKAGEKAFKSVVPDVWAKIKGAMP